ncbi:hypothetical protein [Metabacillus malikii]|uniref:Uncharacterized protein n=1 Tax=Metabacillus malikii TaxID=1504265 RepID=A0ABT9ZLH0_9BACI|nr:hypothetical protein [Metabacillus malikii]MDQ0232368.1 hypothetical protein [Metabacillus malikii]
MSNDRLFDEVGRLFSKVDRKVSKVEKFSLKVDRQIFTIKSSDFRVTTIKIPTLFYNPLF